MYKKMAALLVVLGLLCVPAFADESTEKAGWFFAGGGTTFTPQSPGGGYGEFSFLLYHNNWDIRNHFIIRGAGLRDRGDNYGLLTISEKISFGGILSDNRFRVYGFFEGGAGLFGHDSKDFFEFPLVYGFGGGGGTDIFFSKDGSVYLESGYLGQILGSAYIGGPIFQIGWRSYF
jgi:hypothetical protein